MPMMLRIGFIVSAWNIASLSRANVTSRMWPASMLAKSRTVSENGRTKIVEMNSIGVDEDVQRLGHAGGEQVALK